LRGQGIYGTTARTLAATAVGSAEIPIKNEKLLQFGVFVGEVR
jgi:hypothetical protein